MITPWTATSGFKFTKEYFDVSRVYAEVPEVYDGFSWYLPYVPRISRTVCMKGDHRTSRVDKFYELWSPNTNLHEFYPGSPLDNDDIIPASHWTDFIAFPDGRLGPYDWSLHPQHFSWRAPWLGFCRRPPTDIAHWTDVPAELAPLPLVFLHSNSYPGKGKLDPEFARRLFDRAEFLGTSVGRYKYTGHDSSRKEDIIHLRHVLDSRPRYPGRADGEALVSDGRYWTWEQLVVVFTCVQRGLREMEAWLTMMEHLPNRGRDFSNTLHIVNHDRIGLWLNTANEYDGHWLLNTGIVPVYLIHRFVQDVEFPKWSSVTDRRQDRSNWLYDFVEGTPAETFNSNANLYIQVFNLFGNRKIRNFHKYMLKSGQDPKCEAVDRQRSSSWAANSDPSADCGYNKETGYGDPDFVQDTGKPVNLARVDAVRGSCSQAEPVKSSSSCKRDNTLSKVDINQTWGLTELHMELPARHSRSIYMRTLQHSDPEINPPSPICPQRSMGEFVVDGNVSFWKPPPLVYGPRSRAVDQTKWDCKQKKTTWLLFVEVDYETEFGCEPPEGHGATIMVARSKLPSEDLDEHDSSAPLEQRTYFDRHQGRRLVFRSSLIPPGHVFFDVSVFGFPLQNRTFCTSENHKLTILPFSDWVYSTPHPSNQHEIGSLPTLDECRPTTPAFIPPLDT